MISHFHTSNFKRLGKAVGTIFAVTVMSSAYLLSQAGPAMAATRPLQSARRTSSSAFGTPIGPAIWICNRPGPNPVNADVPTTSTSSTPDITCGTVQWFEKQASVNGTTGYLKIQTVTPSSGPTKVIDCALGVLGEAAVTYLSEGTTALYTVPEAVYDASCAAAVASSYISGFFR